MASQNLGTASDAIAPSTLTNSEPTTPDLPPTSPARSASAAQSSSASPQASAVPDFRDYAYNPSGIKDENRLHLWYSVDKAIKSGMYAEYDVRDSYDFLVFHCKFPSFPIRLKLTEGQMPWKMLQMLIVQS